MPTARPCYALPKMCAKSVCGLMIRLIVTSSGRMPSWTIATKRYMDAIAVCLQPHGRQTAHARRRHLLRSAPASFASMDGMVSIGHLVVLASSPAPHATAGRTAPTVGPPSSLTGIGRHLGISCPHQGCQLARHFCPDPNHRRLRAREHRASWPNRRPRTTGFWRPDTPPRKSTHQDGNLG